MLPSSWIAAGAGAGLGFAAVIVGLSAGAVAAEEIGATLTPEILQDIARVEAEIDLIEAQTLERLAAPPDNQVQQIELLGKSMLYDKQLSVLRNEACAFCHMPETGFTGPVSELNHSTGTYPGSVRTRYSERKPQTHAYAPLSPVLHYNPAQGVTWSGEISGTCVRPVADWAIRRLNRPRGRPPIPSRWGCQILRVRSIEPRSGRIVLYSKKFGGIRLSRLGGRATWSRSVINRDHLPPQTPSRFISTRRIADAPARRSIKWRSLLHPTKHPPR